MVPVDTRRRYAEEIRKAANLKTQELVEAFAAVPREEYVGRGPWKVLTRPAPGQMQSQASEVVDPADLYRDVAVLLHPARTLTNGNPVTLAPWLDALGLSKGKSIFHLGCGTGYYTAIMAEAVGPSGQVTAAEIDPALAAEARASLARYPNVEVIEGDGGAAETGRRDAFLINAGVTHAQERWLDNLSLGGRLVLPLTVEVGIPNIGKGMVLAVSRLESGYAARFFPAPVMIYSCSSVRDAQAAAHLSRQFMTGTSSAVQSLRRDSHAADPDCWLHTSTFCLSTRPVV